jgi:hypothetical protein
MAIRSRGVDALGQHVAHKIFSRHTCGYQTLVLHGQRIHPHSGTTAERENQLGAHARFRTAIQALRAPHLSGSRATDPQERMRDYDLKAVIASLCDRVQEWTQKAAVPCELTL